MSFPRYPKYKASGVEWLGDVPEGWEVKPLRYVCYCLDGIRVPLNSAQRAEKQGDVPYWGANSIMDYVDEALFDENLVLLGEDGAPFFDKLKPIAFFSQGRVWPNNHVHVLRPVVTGTAKFITHVLNITDFAHFIDGSTRDKLTQGSMKEIPLPFPPLPEQTAIAEFLDRETGKIDELVAEQRRLMELLKEKRQAVISHAVTKGLNPHAPMKPSGIEWLGDVPVGWKVGPVKRFFKSCNTRRIPLSGEERGGRSGVYPYYGASGIIDHIDEFIFDEDLVLVSEDGANLLNRASPIAFVAIEKYWVNNHAHILRPIDSNLTFWAARIESIDITPFVTGSAQPKFTSEALGALTISVPSSENERVQIQQHITSESSKFDTLTAEAQRAIDLLQERRTALISAAVTGQIDVRHQPWN
jgi:type I restriction enzyme S subunit